MFKGKKTKLFWCGLFVLILGIFNQVVRILNVPSGYNIYLQQANSANQQFPYAHVFWSNFLITLIVNTIVWSIIWIITIAVGLFIMKADVKKETNHSPSQNSH